MRKKLSPAGAAACSLALLLSLAACGRGSEGGADRAVRNSTGTEQSSSSAGSTNDAAVRAAVQRSAANNTAPAR